MNDHTKARRVTCGLFLFRAKPVNDAVDDAGGRAVDDDRARDGKHFGGHAGDEALGLKLDRRRNDGVCKARDGYDRPRAGKLCDIVIPAEPGQDCA